jgi:hypothetical protein
VNNDRFPSNADFQKTLMDTPSGSGASSERHGCQPPLSSPPAAQRPSVTMWSRATNEKTGVRVPPSAPQLTCGITSPPVGWMNLKLEAGIAQNCTRACMTRAQAAVQSCRYRATAIGLTECTFRPVARRRNEISKPRAVATTTGISSPTPSSASASSFSESRSSCAGDLRKSGLWGDD